MRVYIRNEHSLNVLDFFKYNKKRLILINIYVYILAAITLSIFENKQTNKIKKYTGTLYI